MSFKSGFIAIVGRPNAGKSTLLNHVLGSKVSIVTPKAQTTRERVLGILTEKTGQIVFIDTPGIHRAKEGGINEYMMHEAEEALDTPNLVWYIVDPRSSLEHEKVVLDLIKPSGAPVLMLVNKSDLGGKKIVPEAFERVETQLKAAAAERGIKLESVRRISASRGDGVTDLLKDSWAYLPEGPMYYQDSEQLSDRPMRFFVAEKIREQLLLNLGEEIPYSCAVEIEKFDEKSEPPRIEAVIHVERDSQKGMVVGKGGSKIKEIGQKARAEIEAFIGTKIFLGLRVKLTQDWSRDVDALKRLGYALPPDRAKAARKARTVARSGGKPAKAAKGGWS